LLDLNITNTIINGGEIIINDVCPSPQKGNLTGEQPASLICNFTAQGYNNIVKTKNSVEFGSKCSECRLIDKDGTSTTPISCPTFGGTVVSNCTSDDECLSGQVCQGGVCVQDQIKFPWDILIIGAVLLGFLVILFVIFWLIRRNQKYSV
jgi:hypothetical protein